MKRPIARESRYPMAEYTAWAYPEDGCYYGWYDSMPPLEPSDSDIKSQLVDQLRVNPHTKDEVIRVDVEHKVAVRYWSSILTHPTHGSLASTASRGFRKRLMSGTSLIGAR